MSGSSRPSEGTVPRLLTRSCKLLQSVHRILAPLVLAVLDDLHGSGKVGPHQDAHLYGFGGDRRLDGHGAAKVLRATRLIRWDSHTNGVTNVVCREEDGCRRCPRSAYPARPAASGLSRTPSALMGAGTWPTP